MQKHFRELTLRDAINFQPQTFVFLQFYYSYVDSKLLGNFIYQNRCYEVDLT